MKSDHTMHTCPGCGCAEGETPNDDCWTCQHDADIRAGEPLMALGVVEEFESFGARSLRSHA